jgi:hypothetical protein
MFSKFRSGILNGSDYWEHEREGEDNIKVDIKDMECQDVDWIHVNRERGSV